MDDSRSGWNYKKSGRMERCNKNSPIQVNLPKLKFLLTEHLHHGSRNLFLGPPNFWHLIFLIWRAVNKTLMFWRCHAILEVAEKFSIQKKSKKVKYLGKTAENFSTARAVRPICPKKQKGTKFIWVFTVLE